MERKLTKESSLFAFTSTSCCAYDARLKTYDPPELDSVFSNRLKTLPEDLEEEEAKEKYYAFFERYGTHFTHFVRMGAMQSQRSELNFTSVAKLRNNSVSVEGGANLSCKCKIWCKLRKDFLDSEYYDIFHLTRPSLI